jgi:hypothetical protein
MIRLALFLSVSSIFGTVQAQNFRASTKATVRCESLNLQFELDAESQAVETSCLVKTKCRLEGGATSLSVVSQKVRTTAIFSEDYNTNGISELILQCGNGDDLDLTVILALQGRVRTQPQQPASATAVLLVSEGQNMDDVSHIAKCEYNID